MTHQTQLIGSGLNIKERFPNYMKISLDKDYAFQFIVNKIFYLVNI